LATFQILSTNVNLWFWANRGKARRGYYSSIPYRFSGAASAPSFMESPLPHSNLTQQLWHFTGREISNLTSSEGTVLGRRTQGSRSARSSRERPPARPYNGRRVSHYIRSDFQPIHPAHSLPLSPAHTPTSRSYSTIPAEVEYRPYSRPTVPPSQPSPSPMLPPLDPIPIDPPISTPPGEMPPTVVQPSAVERQTLHMYLPAYAGGAPRLLLNVNRLTAIPSS